MGINNNFILRGYLNETTTHRDRSYSSPDIIGHKQVLDPVTYFRNNYSKDPNESLDISSQFNTTYVRARNLASSGVRNKGYLHLYQCGCSLFMKPSLWKNYQMKTMGGMEYVELNSDTSGQIVVGNDCFRVSNKDSGRYCLAAVISDSPQAHIPDDFKNSDEYVYWVKTNPGVTFRNLNVVRGYSKPTYEETMLITGSGVRELTVFELSCVNVPLGTKIRMECSALGFDVDKTYDGDSLSTSLTAPAGYSTYVIMSATTPNGKWPANAELVLNYYTTVKNGSLSYEFGMTPEELGIHKDLQYMSAMSDFAGPTGRLVLAGSCGTVFVS